MITGELKNKINSLWDAFAAGSLFVCDDFYEQKQGTSLKRRQICTNT